MTREDLKKEIELEEEAKNLIQRGYVKDMSVKELVKKLKKVK